jgi:hypothetical protein
VRWGVDVELSVSLALGRLVAKDINDDISTTKIDISKTTRTTQHDATTTQLTTESEDGLRILQLVPRGREADAKGSKLVRQLASGVLSAGVKDLCEHMQKAVGFRPQMNETMKRKLVPAEKAMLACLLHHTSLDTGLRLFFFSMISRAFWPRN